MKRHLFFHQRLALVLLEFCAVLGPSFAQTTFQRTYGGTEYDAGYSVQQTSDGGYIIAGVSGSFGPGGGVYLIKTDSLGDTLWTRTCGDTNGGGCQSVQQSSDGGYIIAGHTYAGLEDVYLVKTNSSGDTLWTRSYGGTNWDRGHSVRQTSDGGYIIAGITNSFGAGLSDVYLVKTNSSGDTLWTRAYGGTNYDFAYSVQQTSDTGYIVAGWTLSFGSGAYDMYLVKTNSSGDTLWTRTYGGTDWDHGYSVQETSDGGYIIAGETRSFGAEIIDVYLVRTNSSGDTLWTKRYGGANTDVGSSVRQTSDGGYIIAGETISLGAGEYDVYLVKTNSLGDTLWTRTYGGTDNDVGFSVWQTLDSGYVVAGFTYSFGLGVADVYLIKTLANGLLGDQDDSSAVPPGFTLLQNYPNPFNSTTTMSFSIPSQSLVSLRVFDVLGREVSVLLSEEMPAGTYKQQWNAEGVASGMYFYRLQAGSFMKTRKLVLLR